MCGIAGFAGQGTPGDLSGMTRALGHRGPDAEGFFHDRDNSVFFGHKRLSILDIKDGAQPMSTRDGSLVITFNGEIYNHGDLRAELEKKGHVFVSHHSDTEVLLHGYREWGEALPERLNGMWAFALYDKSVKRLFLSRDRFGKKPLFYSFQNNTFAFSSELSSLARHSRMATSLSERSLRKYFAYGYIPAPNSIYKGVRKLPGGCNLVVDLTTRAMDVKKYWEFVLEPFDHIPANPEQEWGEQLRDLLSKAVKRRLMSDVPLGIFLSGGVDSSAVSAFAASFNEPGALRTFSIGFKEESFDESAYSAMVAKFLGTNHYNEVLSIENSRNLLPEIAARLDEPMGDSSLLPTYLLSQTTRKHVTVALGGDGADELFAGYDPFHALKLARLYSKMVPKPVHRAVQLAVSLLPVSHRNMSLDFKLKRTLRGLGHPDRLWNPVWLGPLSPGDIRDLFQGPMDLEDLYSEAIEAWDACKQPDIINKTLQFYTRLYLQDDILVKVDRASMMNSLEVRAPFLDIDFVDFARRIPHTYKYRNGQTKYILKKALEPVLPKEILYRAKKGFGIPVGQWLKQPCFDLTPSGGGGVPFLNPMFIAGQQRDHLDNRADNRAFLWNYWLLKTWRKTSS